MNMSNNPFIQEANWQRLKSGIIQLAKTEVLARFENVSVETKQDGSLLTEADTQMQLKTQSFLAKNWPEFAFLGEESSTEAQEKAMNSKQGCWILDPVDGTSNFAIGIPVYTVSLALTVQGNIIAGLVYDPSRDELFAARQNMGAELNHQPFTAKTAKTALSQCSSIVDFKRLQPDLAIRLATQAPYASQRSFGSVALDWCWIAAGRGQVYLHGSQNIWDYAAGWLILEEAGGQSQTLDQQTVLLAKVEKRSAVAATTPELFKEWNDFLQN
ncbi:MAG: inositol monophosphatase [Thiomicrorhabdus sp.]|nr:inositol monophosphatase [Thiomicrorhabdus sp.]